MLDNIGTQQYFGINSYETAEEISKRIGDMTIPIETENFTDQQTHPTGVSAQPQGGSRSHSKAINHSEIARRLLKPEEVLTLPPDVCLIFHKHLPVCVGRLVKYFEAPEFKRGGIAAPRRLGLAAAVLAMFTLLASCLLTAAALVVAGPQPRPMRPGVKANREAPGGGRRRPRVCLKPPPLQAIPGWRRTSGLPPEVIRRAGRPGGAGRGRIAAPAKAGF